MTSPVYSRARRTRQDISRVYGAALLQWFHGRPVNCAAVNAQVEQIPNDDYAEVLEIERIERDEIRP